MDHLPSSLRRTVGTRHNQEKPPYNVRTVHAERRVLSFPAFTRIHAEMIENNSQSTRNQESTIRTDHRGSEWKDLVQGDASRRGLEQNDHSSVQVRSDEGHLEEYQEYMLRGTEYLGRLV